MLNKEQHREYAAKVAFGQAEQMRRMSPDINFVYDAASLQRHNHFVGMYQDYSPVFLEFPDIDNDYREYLKFQDRPWPHMANVFGIADYNEVSQNNGFFDFAERSMNSRSIHADVPGGLPYDFKPLSFFNTHRPDHKFDSLFDDLRSFSRNVNITLMLPKAPDNYAFEAFVPKIGTPDFSLLSPIDIKGVNLKQSDIGGVKKPDLFDTYVSAAFITNEDFTKVLTIKKGKQRKLDESQHAVKYSIDLLPKIDVEEVDAMKAVREISEHPPKDNKKD